MSDFFNNVVEAGISKKAAKPLGKFWRAHAVAMRPDNPAQWFKDNFKEIVRVETVNGQAYRMVTNEKLTADTKVPVIDVTNLKIPNVKKNKDKINIFGNLIGKSFKLGFDAGNGIVKFNSTAEHFVNSSKNNKKHRLDPMRLKGLSAVEELLKNAVYVDKHEDVNGTDTRHIDFYIPIKDGNNISLFLLVAKENIPDSNKFTIGEANFYDYIKKDPVQSASGTDLSGLQGAEQTGSLFISIADMLRNVKDRNGKDYVDANGNLNYEPGVLKLLNQNSNSYNQQDLGATSWDEAGRATITLMQKADASTLIHESGHVFLEALWNDIQRGIVTEQERKAFEILNY